MIVGLDTGIETSGWALLDEKTCTLEDLGVVVQKRTPSVSLNLDRVERALLQANELARRAKGASTIVIEALSFGGGIASIAPISLSYGLALGIAASQAEPPIVLTISPQRWQREVMPQTGKKVDYPELAAQLSEHIRARHPAAYEALQRILPRHRNHALDAAALALVGALRPRSCMAVGLPRSRARRSKALRVIEEAEPVWMPREGLPAGGRDECRNGERPCPYVKCKHHLWLVDGRDRTGQSFSGKPLGTTLKPRWLEHPTPPCCELDILEMKRERLLPIARVAEAFGLTEDWTRQVIDRATAKLENSPLADWSER